MFLEILLTVMMIMVWIGTITYMTGEVTHSRAVRGSLRRHQASTLRAVGAITVVISSLVKGPVNIIMGNHVAAAFDILTILVFGYLLWRYRNDDNWFNDQRKRLKKGWRELKRRLASIKLSPTPSPMPA